jgi:hypothetical protein
MASLIHKILFCFVNNNRMICRVISIVVVPEIERNLYTCNDRRAPKKVGAA